MRKKKAPIPHHVNAWWTAGFEFIEIMDGGYIRVSDTETDKPGSRVILIDGFGAFRAYIIGDGSEEYPDFGGQYTLEFTESMTKALIATWKYSQVEFLK